MKTIGQALLEHRTRLGLTQRAAADQMGVEQANYQRWESSKAEPAADSLDAIFRWLQVDQTQAALMVLWTRLSFAGVELEVAQAWRASTPASRRPSRSRRPQPEVGRQARDHE